MEIDWFTWPLREPIRSRPVAGGVAGALAGFGFGILAVVALNSDPELFEAGQGPVLLGYSLGGLVAGLIIGSMLPAFRSRIVAGFIVGIAAVAGLGVAWWFWEEFLGWPELIFVAGCLGFVYAMLLWDYRVR